MKLYDCRVRINGSLNHVQPRYGVTAAEIVLLRFLHSQSEAANEPVIDIIESGEIARKDAIERRRLAEFYSFGELGGERLINRVLGVAGVPLPQAVELVDDDEVIEVEKAEEETLPVAPAQIKVEKASKKAELVAHAKAQEEKASTPIAA